VGGSDVGRLSPILGGTIALTAAEGGILGQGVACVSSSVSLLHLRLNYSAANSMYQNLN
jgi:hypothetical protein